MNNYNTLLIDIADRTATIVINRESKLNALNAETLSELADVLNALADNDEVRGIILTGSGSKAFVAGADIQEFIGLSTDEASAKSRLGHEQVMDAIQNSRKPIIAAINGFALGGGLELAMACHIRIGSLSAKMGLPEVSLGIIPGYGGTQRLVQLVGRGKALEMIMSGEMIDAQDAHQWGLLNKVVVEEELLETCKSLLKKIYSRSRLAVGYAIEAVNAGLSDNKEGYNTEIRLFGESFGTHEAKEGISAFLEKRKPNF